MNIKEWKTISCTLNGQVRELTVSPAARLSDVLREQGLMAALSVSAVPARYLSTVSRWIPVSIWRSGRTVSRSEPPKVR